MKDAIRWSLLYLSWLVAQAHAQTCGSGEWTDSKCEASGFQFARDRDTVCGASCGKDTCCESSMSTGASKPAPYVDDGKPVAQCGKGSCPAPNTYCCNKDTVLCAQNNSMCMRSDGSTGPDITTPVRVSNTPLVWLGAPTPPPTWEAIPGQSTNAPGMGRPICKQLCMLTDDDCNKASAGAWLRKVDRMGDCDPGSNCYRLRAVDGPFIGASNPVLEGCMKPGDSCALAAARVTKMGGKVVNCSVYQSGLNTVFIQMFDKNDTGCTGTGRYSAPSTLEVGLNDCRLMKDSQVFFAGQCPAVYAGRLQGYADSTCKTLTMSTLVQPVTCVQAGPQLGNRYMKVTCGTPVTDVPVTWLAPATSLAPAIVTEYVYMSQPWGGCSVQCGEGIKRRAVYCASRDKGIRVDIAYCGGVPPQTSETCLGVTPGCSPTTRYITGAWSPCSVTCGEGGTRRRIISCVGAKSEILPLSNCSRFLVAPAAVEECNSAFPCPSFEFGCNMKGVLSVGQSDACNGLDPSAVAWSKSLIDGSGKACCDAIRQSVETHGCCFTNIWRPLLLDRPAPSTPLDVIYSLCAVSDPCLQHPQCSVDSECKPTERCQSTVIWGTRQQFCAPNSILPSVTNAPTQMPQKFVQFLHLVKPTEEENRMKKINQSPEPAGLVVTMRVEGGTIEGLDLKPAMKYMDVLPYVQFEQGKFQVVFSSSSPPYEKQGEVSVTVDSEQRPDDPTYFTCILFAQNPADWKSGTELGCFADATPKFGDPRLSGSMKPGTASVALTNLMQVPITVSEPNSAVGGTPTGWTFSNWTKQSSNSITVPPRNEFVVTDVLPGQLRARFVPDFTSTQVDVVTVNSDMTYRYIYFGGKPDSPVPGSPRWMEVQEPSRAPPISQYRVIEDSSFLCKSENDPGHKEWLVAELQKLGTACEGMMDCTGGCRVRWERIYPTCLKFQFPSMVLAQKYLNILRMCTVPPATQRPTAVPTLSPTPMSTQQVLTAPPRPAAHAAQLTPGALVLCATVLASWSVYALT